MSQLSKLSICVAVIGSSILSSSVPVMAQSTATHSESVLEKKPTAAPACDNTVAPIKRAKKSAKPVNTPSVDWTTMASTYSHDANGQRVDQYAMAVEPQSMERPDFVRSGFRHSRSTLQAGFSSDNYHVTESWGQPVRPYGEWRYPNRPFSVPYGQWGPQLPQVVVGGNQYGMIGPWGMYPGMNPNAGLNPANNMNAANNAAFANGPFQGNLQGNGIGIGNGNGNGAINGNAGINGNQMVMPGVPNGPGAGVWGQGQWWPRPGQGFGNGQPYPQGQGFGVGPQNVLPAGQDEYYPQAPIYHPMPDDGFQSPFRN